jgi:hypothetical protein
MVMGNEGWRTPDESWLDIEAAEDGKTFFVDIVIEGDVGDEESWRHRGQGRVS